MSVFDPFYPIVDSAAWVGRLVGVGAKFIQLRIKDAVEDDLRRETHHAITICRRSGAELVVNDHWEIGIDAGADWIHLGQGDLDEADIPPPPAIVLMTLASADLEQTADYLTQWQIEFHDHTPHSIVVPPALATGVALEFVAG